MLRRILISALCIGLASLAPVPLSACAMLMKLPTECAPATSPAADTAAASHCEQMANEAAEPANVRATLREGAMDRSCCNVTSAPAADISPNATQAHTATAPAVIEGSPETIPTIALLDSASGNEFRHPIQPLNKQILLCTFLI